MLLAENQYDEIRVTPSPDSYEGHYSRTKFYYKVIKDGKYGAITCDGVLVLKPEHRAVSELFDGVFIVKTSNGKFAAYTESGEELLPAKYNKMKREKRFIIGSTQDGEVSVICRDKLLARDVKCNYVSKHWYYIFLQKENSFVLCSVKGFIGEYNGVAKYRQGDYVEIITENQRKIIFAIDGSVVIPIGEYKSIKKQNDVFLAECYDGNIITGEIKK